MDVLMPQLGETVAEGTVTQWYKNVGDSVSENESLFDVETDKVSTEIPAPAAGVLVEILVASGETVKVGTRLAVIRAAGDAGVAPPPARAAGPDTAAVPAPAVTAAAPPPSVARVPAAERGDGATRLSPVVRRLLAEHKLAAAAIAGSGRDGRITRDDVLAHVEKSRAGAAPAASVAPAPTAAPAAVAPSPPAPVAAVSRPSAQAAVPAPPAPAVATPPAPHETVIALNSVRRRSAAAMARSWLTIPHVLQAVEADFHAVETARAARGAQWRAAEGFTLTYLPFIARAVCNALAKYPQINARLDGDSLIVSRRVHLGIAVDLGGDGLIVPVVKDAQDKTLKAMAREIHALTQKARAGGLKPDDLTQATYTLSNSGVFGTLITAPIVNPPQVAILSTDGVRKKPVVIETAAGDAIAVRPVGVLAQSFDHRAVDGAYSAGFLREVKSILEQRDWLTDLPG